MLCHECTHSLYVYASVLVYVQKIMCSSLYTCMDVYVSICFSLTIHFSPLICLYQDFSISHLTATPDACLLVAQSGSAELITLDLNKHFSSLYSSVSPSTSVAGSCWYQNQYEGFSPIHGGDNGQFRDFSS